MANKVLIKRSAVQSKNPATTDLSLGELALNTYDGNLFFKKSPGGTDSIVTVVTLDGTQTLTNKTLTSPSINGGALSGTFSGSITFSDTTASTSTTTGALKLAGGLGVAGALNAASVKVNNAYTLPTSDGVLNYVMSTNGTGQLSFIDVNSLVSASQTANFSYSQDLGLVTQAVTSIGDLGALIDAVSTTYNWGTFTSGNIYPDEFVLPSYTISTLPTGQNPGQMLYVSNESGGAVIAFSDGTNWRRVTDRVIVS
jgi:hypothetical protein